MEAVISGLLLECAAVFHSIPLKRTLYKCLTSQPHIKLNDSVRWMLVCRMGMVLELLPRDFRDSVELNFDTWHHVRQNEATVFLALTMNS